MQPERPRCPRCENDRAGIIAAPAIDLYKIVSRLSGRIEFEIAADQYQLTLRAGPTTFSLACMGADDFPDGRAAQTEMAHSFVLQADEFRSLIGRVRYAISRDETRYYLNGVNLSPINGSLRAVATDGRRMAEVRMPCPDGATSLPSIIIPHKTVRLLSEIVKSDPVALSFSADKLHGLFQTGHLTLKSKMIDGTYPDTERVKPKANDKIVTFDAPVLYALIRRVTAAHDKGARALRFTWEKDSLTVSTSSGLWGSASEALPVSYPGLPFEVGFDYRYVQDILRGRDGALQMTALDSRSPVVFSDPADTNAEHILMPMQIV